MAIQSGGIVLKGQRTVWQGSPAEFPGWRDIPLTGGFYATYQSLYERQMWVGTVVDKLAWGLARLPLKVYERDDLNRPEASNHPYAQLLRRPNERQSPMLFWLWVSSMFDVYGEAFLLKQRDRGGRPIALLPLHPSAMHEEDEVDGEVRWTFRNGTLEINGIRNSDLVHPRNFNPSSATRGLSKLERLRSTLEFEDAARRAQSSFWAKGARPGVALSHPGNISQPAADRLKMQWNEVAAGADNFGTTVVLEEGMKPEVLTLSAEEAQYIESRKLNREEVIAAYDMPPPAVHVLDHATFSNITEQMRSVYRDTQAPRCKLFEGSLELELRGAVRPGASEPDFGEEVYAEFLMDEVLRGDFEVRIASWATAIQTGQATPAEARRAENRPFIEGSDRLLLQGAMVPLVADDAHEFTPNDRARIEALGTLIRAGFDAASAAAALGLPPIQHTGLLPITVQSEDQIEADAAQSARGLSDADVRTVMGRLSRQHTLAEVDTEALVKGLGVAAVLVAAALNASKAVGEPLPVFRQRIKALGGPS